MKIIYQCINFIDLVINCHFAKINKKQIFKEVFIANSNFLKKVVFANDDF